MDNRARKFTSIDQVLADLQAKAQSRQSEKLKRQEKLGEAEYECEKCKDTEFILFVQKGPNGYPYDMARPCDCRAKKAWQRRFKNAMIPDEFTNAKLDTYQRNSKVQEKMYQLTMDYLRGFDIQNHEDGSKDKTLSSYNFGLVAVFGEQRLKELPSGERSAVKRKHNNFGIGKTHLQIALAKKLIKEGFSVLVVSDVVLMEELIKAKMMNDEGETLNGILGNAISADVLVWDDIGKSKWSESKESLYYQIINERYRKQKPIVFNSNEDRGTLAEKIGYAAASRLIGQAGDFFLEAEGEDWRLKKGV